MKNLTENNKMTNQSDNESVNDFEYQEANMSFHSEIYYS
jgi:hypothetical protein